MRPLPLLPLFLAALVIAIAVPDASGLSAKAQQSPPKCQSLKCILSFPDMHTIVFDDLAALSPSSPVDVVLHFASDQITNGRSAAERITGISIDHFIAPSSFAATVPASSLKTLADEPLVRSVTRLLPEHKFSLSDLRRFFSGDAHAPKILPFSILKPAPAAPATAAAAPSSPITDSSPPPLASSSNPDFRRRATIIVLTHSHSATAIAAALSRAAPQLSSTETCKVAAVAHNKVALSFTHASFDFVSRAAAFAASLPGTIHVQPRAEVHLMNYYATGNIQSGTMNPVAGASPLWDAGSYNPSTRRCPVRDLIRASN